MAKIKIEKATEKRLKQLGVDSWSPWGSGVCTFDWHYSSEEQAYVLEGKVKVKTADEEVEINKGDLVTFPKGLSCTWTVIEPIKKVYTFN